MEKSIMTANEIENKLSKMDKRIEDLEKNEVILERKIAELLKFKSSYDKLSFR